MATDFFSEIGKAARQRARAGSQETLPAVRRKRPLTLRERASGVERQISVMAPPEFSMVQSNYLSRQNSEVLTPSIFCNGRSRASLFRLYNQRSYPFLIFCLVIRSHFRLFEFRDSAETAAHVTACISYSRHS